jgi:serine/threonine-protein kinase RsbW
MAHTRLQLDNDFSELETLNEAIEAFIRDAGLNDALAFNLNLALEELFTNIVKYAFPEGGQHLITIELEGDGDAMTAIVEDDGVAFNPLADPPEVDVDAGIDERDIGGLGLHFVKTFAHKVDYERTADRNRLTLQLLARP